MMTLNSCIYIGQVRHRRFEPRSHRFHYRLFMMYLDLSELEKVFKGRWFWSASRRALARFRREDHLGDPMVPLDVAVRDVVQAETGHRPEGPVRLLTHLRYFGYCFNPVSFYYCFDAGDGRVESIVAEVNNTPWGERHVYVLSADQPHDGVTGRNLELRKRFHVSPFMPMDIDYDWRFSEPADRLSVHMKNDRDGRHLFDATLRLERRPITTKNLASTLLRFPVMTLSVVAAIYFEALRLWLKRTPLFDHPVQPEAPRTANRP
jgi:uncharacterized protein